MTETLEIIFAPALIELLSLREKQKGKPLTKVLLNDEYSFLSSLGEKKGKFYNNK